MNPVLKNILAVVLGWLLGSIVNLALVYTGHSVFPIEGVDPNDMEAIAEVMPTLSSEYFVFPFLAHAIGTLVGVIFLLGGIWASTMIPAPTWFIATDLIIAYIPMAWLGGKLGSKTKHAA